MTTTKIRLSIALPGGVLYSQEESCKLQQPVVKNGNTIKEATLIPDKSKHKEFEVRLMDRGKPVSMKVSVRKSKPATQVINLCEEAYEEFINPNIIPYKYKGVWRGLTNNQRVQWHCQQIAEAMGGTLESFVVLD